MVALEGRGSLETGGFSRRLLGLPPRARAAIVPALVVVALVQLWAGAARPGTIASPAGEGGLCLALVVWWSGGGATLALALWALTLLSWSAVSGVAPVWPFLVGWPAWLAVRALVGTARSRPVALLLLAACLVSILRCGGKLLLLSWPELGSPLTLSGAGLLGSFWAELSPNLVWLWAFWLLLRSRSEGSQDGPS